ncbi:GMC family oxidoreductase [Mycobacterium branderi]|uniref:Dehydrogenase n=1 Tax=Mycobacterium branderi TaxID=43348 RepID=A0A7I7W2H8_9MYCO|nr:GMC oxidoreductase [Mycobacterium branderi]MCV7233791.1 GMC family oxidoreductase N-terminal domain-containing protein [Mycobacterium branderi]ORA39667.1 hypothetical protein BST20_09230 [Mycobacterium branderi]BBZ11756.1 dehydrogenase [Mycobacterium branderi]
MNGEIDTIIVGAGSAGSVLTARLTEDPSRGVLLIETGPDFGSNEKDQPVDVIDADDSTATEFDWHHRGTVLGRELPLYAGKIVGGSSATNNVMALRGHRGIYDDWGAAGWSFCELLPAFRRLEHDIDYPRSRWHGDAGPVRIRRTAAEEMAAAQEAFMTSAVAAGHRSVDDHNHPCAVGVGALPLNQVDGIRQSTALTYLRAARARPNLQLRSAAQVDRLLIRRGAVLGVKLVDGTDVYADSVVLSAGAFGSPAILLRSGIGPADDLRPLGIPVVLDRPGVGRNLHDHPLVRIDFATDGPPTQPVRQTILTAHSDGTGGPPDLQLFPSGPTRTGEATLLVSLLRPQSRGRLRLTSADPSAPLAIDPGYLTDPADLTRLVAGVELARQLAATAPFKRHIGSATAASQPLVSRHGDELRCAVTDHVNAYHHPVGTCRMGRSDDMAVVDHTGRVHGVQRLRVIDASIFPVIPAANTNVPTLMAAEHLAHTLRW